MLCQQRKDAATAVEGAIWLTEVAVASRTSISLSKLRSDRFKQRGIPYSKVDRSVRYALSDVLEFMQQNRVDPN